LTDRSSSQRPEPGEASAGAAQPRPGAPGLGEQFGRTRKALLGLVAAHIDLAKAEFSEIAGEVKKAAALGGMALLLLLTTGLLIVIGVLLFVGEAMFGSMGWGVLLGTELLIGGGALLVLAIVDLTAGRLAASVVVAAGVGLVIGGLLAADWAGISRGGSGLLGEPWFVAGLSGAVLVALLGTLLASSFGRGFASAAAIAGFVIGALVGLLASANPGLRIAAALGVAFGLLFWPISAAVLVFRRGVDTEKLKKRFVPEQTIETTKETIEWVREQMPLGRKS
jgi:hypothetical protein